MTEVLSLYMGKDKKLYWKRSDAYVYKDGLTGEVRPPKLVDVNGDKLEQFLGRLVEDDTDSDYEDLDENDVESSRAKAFGHVRKLHLQPRLVVKTYNVGSKVYAHRGLIHM